LHSGVGDAEWCATRHGILTAQFYNLQLPHNRISLRRLAQPEQAIGDGKYGLSRSSSPHIHRSGRSSFAN